MDKELEQKYLDACLVGDTDTIKHMIKIESERLTSDKFLYQCVNIASEAAHIEIVRTILTHRRSLQLYYMSPSMTTCGCKSGNDEVVRVIFEIYGYRYVREEVYINALKHLCKEGNLEIVKMCLSKTTKTTKPDAKFWNSCLANACRSGNMDMVNFVVDRGAKFYDRDHDKNIKKACKGGNIEIVKRIVDIRSTYLNYWNINLHHACSGGHLKIVKLFINKGANDWNGSLKCACNKGHLKIVKFLLKRLENVGENIEVELLNGCFISACKNGNLKIIDELIKRGANNWSQGLMAACTGKHLELVKLMLMHCNDITHLNDALDYVACHCKGKSDYISADIAHVLISKGANFYKHLFTMSNYKLYSLYCQYKGLNYAKNSQVLKLLWKYPPYNLFVSCTIIYTAKNCQKNCSLRRLPIELVRLLFAYI